MIRRANQWTAMTLEALNPATVGPAHGRLGDVGFIRAYANLQPANGPAGATGRINAAIQAAYREAR